jgi:autotransporter-associated beta strand protein
LTLAGASGGFSGTLTVSQGTVGIANATALVASSNVVIGDANSGATGPTLVFTNGQPAIGSLTVGASVSGANLVSDNSATTATTGVTVNGVTTLNSPLTFTYAGSGSSWHYVAFNQKITGNGGGSGNDTLIFQMPVGTTGNPYWEYDGSVANDFQGNIHVESGAWAIQSFNNPTGNTLIPDGSMVIIDSGATFRINNVLNNYFTETFDGLAGGGAFTSNFGLTHPTLTINANNNDNQGKRVFSGSLGAGVLYGALTFGGSGTQEFQGSGISYTVDTDLNNGTLKLTDVTGWASNLVLGSSNSPVLQLSSTGGGSWTLSSPISGGSTNATVEASGPGTIILAGTNTYAGATTINGGTLQVGSARAIPYGAGAGSVTVATSAVLDLAGLATNVNGLWGGGGVDNSATSSGTLIVGNNNATSSFSGVLENSNSAAGALLALVKVGNGALTLSGTGRYLGGTTVEGGTLILTNREAIADGTSLTVGNPSRFLPAPVVPAGIAAVAPVPEPGALALLAALLGSAAIYRQLRRK